jgi:hypothetical protein
MQFSTIVIGISIVIDDRWGPALTWDILIAAMCKGKYIAGGYFDLMSYCHQR